MKNLAILLLKYISGYLFTLLLTSLIFHCDIPMNLPTEKLYNLRLLDLPLLIGKGWNNSFKKVLWIRIRIDPDPAKSESANN